MSKIDEILEMVSDRTGKYYMKYGHPFGSDDRQEDRNLWLKSAILEEVLKMIGEDEGFSEETPENQYYWQEQNELIKERNQLRSEQRQRITEVFGGEI